MTPFPREAYRPLEPYAPDRRPIPVDLSDNTNRWGAHPGALAAVGEAAAEQLVRYPSVYADDLRAAVAGRFGVPVEAVATGCGSDDLLDAAFRAAGDPGEAIAFLPPTFSMIEVLARMNGMRPREVARGGPSEAEPFGPLPPPDSFLADRPALVYLCRPNNPTGETAPRSWIRAIVDEAGSAGPVIVVDEAYADFMHEAAGGTHAPDDPDALLREAAASDRTVVLRTLSKAWGLAGLRVGFAVGAPVVIREIQKSRGPYKVGRLAERAAVAALGDREGWLAGVVEAVRTERAFLLGALRERGLGPLPSGANFVLLPLPAGAGADAVAAALRERGVAVRPFPSLPGLGDGIRITVGPRAEMDRFLAALDGALAR